MNEETIFRDLNYNLVFVICYQSANGKIKWISIMVIVGPDLVKKYFLND